MRTLSRQLHILKAVILLFLMGLTQAFAAPSFEEKDISEVGWLVTLDNWHYSQDTNSTVFTYNLTTSLSEKDLSHWVLSFDMDETGLSSTNPDTLTSYGLDPTTGVWGIKWDAGQEAGTTMTYTVTVTGAVAVTDIHYAVKGGTYYAVGITQGPGTTLPSGNEYSISGSVFNDINFNTQFDASEPPVNNVTVELLDFSGNIVATVITNSDGNYAFEALIPGDYTVVIPRMTVADDFNLNLHDYFSPTTSTMVLVTIIDQSIDDVNLGFSLNLAAITDDLNQEDPDNDGFSFPGTGRTIGYWKHQLAVAIKGKGRAHINTETMHDYLNWIESFFLVDPFQFTDGNEFNHAYEIMAMRTSDARALLNKQLLATELNHIGRFGLSDQHTGLQEMILKWAEYHSHHSALFSRDELLEVKDLLDTINNMGH